MQMLPEQKLENMRISCFVLLSSRRGRNGSDETTPDPSLGALAEGKTCTWTLALSIKALQSHRTGPPGSRNSLVNAGSCEPSILGGIRLLQESNTEWSAADMPLRPMWDAAGVGGHWILELQGEIVTQKFMGFVCYPFECIQFRNVQVFCLVQWKHSSSWWLLF